MVVCALVVTVLGTATPASAHAALVRTDPGQGSVVRTAPDRVLLTFSEDVLLSGDSLQVLDPSGRQVQQGTAHHAAGGADATVGLRPGLGHGTYTVAWKVVSADTHPVSGAWTFSVGAPSKTTVALPRQRVGGGPAGVLYGIGRFTSYGGFAVLLGASTFVPVGRPRGAALRATQRLAVGGWATLTASTIALLVLRGPYTEGTGLSAVLDPAVLQAAVGTKPGIALVCRLLMLAVAAVLLSVLFGPYARREDPGQRRGLGFGLAAAGTVVAVGTALTWSAAEHASVGPQPGIAMPVDVVHLLAMAVWLGGLAALLTALYRTDAVERRGVRRFSRIAFGCVCLLVATGSYQSWRQVGSWHALTTTSYGRLLLVKLVCVGLLLGTAYFSRHWTGQLAERPVHPPATGTEEIPEAAAPADPVRAAQLARQRAAVATARARRERDADPARGGLRRSVLAEAVIAVVVLAVTTALSGSEPGRTVEQAAADGGVPATAGGPVTVSLQYDTGGAKGKGTAEAHLYPAATGANTLHLVLTDPSGNLVDVPEVTAAFTLPSRRLGPLPVRLKHLDTGEWYETGLELPVPGRWRLAVTVRTSDIDEVTETTNVDIY